MPDIPQGGPAQRVTIDIDANCADLKIGKDIYLRILVKEIGRASCRERV